MTNTSTDIASLADRLEAASGACVGLDADIELVSGRWTPEHYEAWSIWQQCGEAMNPPMYAPCPPNRFSASLDAALSLVPDGRLIGIETYDDNGIYPEHVRASAWVQGAKRQFAATPALALCAAAVRSILRGVPG